MTMASTCSVCCEKMLTEVKCECGFSVCRVCVRTYLAGQVSEPHCMSCKLAWNMNFLESAIGKTYLKTDFKKQRATVFAEHEISQLPDMQEEARIYEITENLNKEIDILKKENIEYKDGTFGCNWCIGNKFKLSHGCNPCKQASGKDKIKMENIRIMNLLKRPDRIMDYIRRMDSQNYNTYFHTYCNYYRLKCAHCNGLYSSKLLYQLLNGSEMVKHIICENCNHNTCVECLDKEHGNSHCMITDCKCHEYECDTCLKVLNDFKVTQLKTQITVITHKEYEIKERKTFIMKCQVSECNGFLSTAYKCGLCSKFTCAQCYMPKEENHDCNPDNVASTKMIKEETRPCPKCSTRIYKIDGCDQMWCTDCKTAFSWKTGIIVNGNIHNPHYYEHLRNTQGHVLRADNPCGEMMDHYHLRSFKHKISSSIKNAPLSNWIQHHFQAIHRYLGEVNDVYDVIQTEINDMDRFIRNLRHNRILFLLKRISKEKFEHDAFMYHQRSVHYRRFLELIQMLKQVVSDIFNNLIGTLEAKLDKKKRVNEPEIIDIVGNTYKELFEVIRYFNKQHSKNHYTKIFTDNYITSFRITISFNDIHSKTRFFVIPEKIEYPKFYDIFFGIITEKDRLSKSLKVTGSHDGNDD